MVYDERKLESQRVMRDIIERRDKTRDVLVYIEKRLVTLEKEQTELKSFQVAEKKRRCLDYLLVELELKESVEKLSALEGLKEDYARKLGQQKTELRKSTEKLEEIETRFGEKRDKKKRYEEEIQIKDNRKREVRNEWSLQKAEVERLTEEKLSMDTELAKMNEEYEETRKKVASEEKALKNDKPIVDQLQVKFRTLTDKFQHAESERSLLKEKCGRKSDYPTIAARNKVLLSDVAVHKEEMGIYKKNWAKVGKELAKYATESKEEKKTLEQLQAQKMELEKAFRESIVPDGKAIEKQIAETEELLRTLKATKNSIIRDIEAVKKDARKFEYQMQQYQGHDFRRAISAIKDLVEEEKLYDRVYGTLLENMEVPERYRLAVESVAGRSLWHMLVRDDTVAERLVTMVRSRHLGRVECVPLSKIKLQERFVYPKLP